MTSRESVEQKAARLLQEGKLQVKAVQFGTGLRAPIVAYCEGDSGKTYSLGYDANERQWRCTCESRRRCSHLVALQLVVRLPEGT